MTDVLYNGDARQRMCQEIVLGMGGVPMLEALGYKHISTYHMSEGHAALLTLALLERETARGNLASVTESDCEAVSQRCVFTTHTPERPLEASGTSGMKSRAERGAESQCARWLVGRRARRRSHRFGEYVRNAYLGVEP